VGVAVDYGTSEYFEGFPLIYTVAGKKEAKLFSTTTLAYLGRFL